MFLQTVEASWWHFGEYFVQIFTSSLVYNKIFIIDKLKWRLNIKYSHNEKFRYITKRKYAQSDVHNNSYEKKSRPKTSKISFNSHSIVTKLNISVQKRNYRSPMCNKVSDEQESINKTAKNTKILPPCFLDRPADSFTWSRFPALLDFNTRARLCSGLPVEFVTKWIIMEIKALKVKDFLKPWSFRALALFKKV